MFLHKKCARVKFVQPIVLMPAMYADDSFSAKCANDDFSGQVC